MGIKEIKNYFPSLDISKYYKFAFVRNPWDRFLSLYNDMTLQRNGNKRVMNYSLLEKNIQLYITKKRILKNLQRVLNLHHGLIKQKLNHNLNIYLLMANYLWIL